MKSNAEMAKILGYHFELIPPYPNDYHDTRMRKLNPNYIHLVILDKKKNPVHHAWYTAPDDMDSPEFYAHVIDHCVDIGCISNWNRALTEIKSTLKKLPKIVQKEILDELA